MILVITKSKRCILRGYGSMYLTEHILPSQQKLSLYTLVLPNFKLFPTTAVEKFVKC